MWSLCAGRPSGLFLRAFYSLHKSPVVKNKRTATRREFEFSVEATHLLIVHQALDFFKQRATLTVLGCGWEPEEEDWPGGLGSEVAGDGESTPVCFWLRGTEADWEIHESEGRR